MFSFTMSSPTVSMNDASPRVRELQFGSRYRWRSYSNRNTLDLSLQPFSLCVEDVGIGTADVWRIPSFALYLSGAVPGSAHVPAGGPSAAAAGLLLWAQTVHWLCTKPERLQALWGLQWGAQTVQVCKRWVNSVMLSGHLYGIELCRGLWLVDTNVWQSQQCSVGWLMQFLGFWKRNVI